jgi:hypothetical protein
VRDPLADLARGRTLRADEVRYAVSHGVLLLRKYWCHLRPDGDAPEWLWRALAAEATVTATAPEWVGERRAAAWLILDEETACPLMLAGTGALEVVTVLVKARYQAGQRRRRQRLRRAQSVSA